MKPERNPAYLAFVRKQPCCVCGKQWGIEACHSGPHGIGQKSPDHSSIPLCRTHHSDARVGLDRIGRAAFEDLHGVNVQKLIRDTRRRAEACGVELDATPERKQPERAGTLSGLRGSRLAR
jgi:hypothetical protein